MNHFLTIESNSNERPHHSNIHSVPGFNRLASQLEWKSFGPFIARQRGGFFVQVFSAFTTGYRMAKLYSRKASQINAAISLGANLPIDPELEVAKIFSRSEN